MPAATATVREREIVGGYYSGASGDRQPLAA